MANGIWIDTMNKLEGTYPINIHASTLLIIHVKLILIQLSIRKYKTSMIPKLIAYKASVLKNEASFVKYTAWRNTQLELIRSLLNLLNIQQCLIIRILWLLEILTKTAFHYIDPSEWQVKGYKFVIGETLTHTTKEYVYQFKVLLNQDKVKENVLQDINNEIKVECLPKSVLNLTDDEKYLLGKHFTQLYQINSFQFELMFFSSNSHKALLPYLNDYLSNEKSSFIYLFPEYPMDKVWPFEIKNDLGKVLNLFLETDKIQTEWFW